MTDELTIDDVDESRAERGSDGDLIPEEHEIEWGDGTKTVKTRPITTGILNELSDIERGIIKLEPDAILEAVRTIYVQPDFDDADEEFVRDLPADKLEALISPLEEEIGVETNGEGNYQSV